MRRYAAEFRGSSLSCKEKRVQACKLTISCLPHPIGANVKLVGVLSLALCCDGASIWHMSHNKARRVDR